VKRKDAQYLNKRVFENHRRVRKEQSQGIN